MKTFTPTKVARSAAPLTGQRAHEIQAFGSVVAMPIALAETTRIAGLWESMVEMVEALDGAIDRLQPRLPASVPQPMARQIFDGARDQARRFLAGSDH